MEDKLAIESGAWANEHLICRSPGHPAKGAQFFMAYAHLKGKRVHVMTPDVSLAQVIREILSPHGVILFHQNTPELAVVHALSRPVDLIILDERMSDLHGKSILVYIRAAAPKSALMIIGEHGHGSCTIDASARGADAVISRRAGREQILNAVCHALGVPYERRPGVGPLHERTEKEPTEGSAVG